MRSNDWLLSILLTFSSVPATGFASDSSTQSANTAVINVGALSAVQSETFLYKAQGERAKALRGIDGDGMQPGFATAPTYPSAPLITDAIQQVGTASEVLPVVKLVSGPSQALRATLLYSSGFEVDAKAGDRDIPGGFRVESISLESVVLSRAGKRYPLGFSSRAPSAGVPGGSIRASGLPGMSIGQPSPISLPGQP